jgi:hypothetical protein
MILEKLKSEKKKMKWVGAAVRVMIVFISQKIYNDTRNLKEKENLKIVGSTRVYLPNKHLKFFFINEDDLNTLYVLEDV